MASNRRARHHVDFRSSWVATAALFAGVGFFLYCVYYFGFTNLLDCNIGQILFYMLLPMAVLAAVVVVLRVMQYDSMQLLSLLAGAYSVLMLLGSFSYGNWIHTIIAVVWYLVLLALSALMLTGNLADNKILAGAFLVTAVVRFLVVDIVKYILTLSLITFVQEAAALCGLIAFGFVAMCFRPIPIKRS